MKNYTTPNMVCLNLHHNDVIMNSIDEFKVENGNAEALTLDWGSLENALSK